MTAVPRDRGLDSTLALVAQGYDFIGRRCRRYRSDIFETRLMLQRAVCIQGEEAARVFYEPGRFTRRGAIPLPVLTLLQDEGSVATLDGEAHRHRKAMFMSVLDSASIRSLVEAMEQEWRARIAIWARTGRVVLFPEVEEILCRAVCRWAGIPLDGRQARRRAREIAAMIDGAGSGGPRNWRGQLLRSSVEHWLRDIVEEIRAGRLAVAEGGAAGAVALHRDAAGRLLSTETAAVELLNLLRPTVAVARYVVFAAHALHEHPRWQTRLATCDEDALTWFVQEVRRFYPFFPAVGGRVRQPFEWRGRRFREGEWVLLDLYGTNRDSRSWGDPDRFRPERFQDRDIGRFDLVPQGGGDWLGGHRCAGEGATIALLKSAVRLLVQEMRYDVPPQDLTIDLARLPAIPKSRFILREVRAAA